MSVPQVAGSLDEARAAARRRAWREAYRLYSEADRSAFEAEDFALFADGAWWSGRLNEALGLRERAYGAFSAAGQNDRAAHIALVLSWDHAGRGAFAVSNGWLANAERLLEPLEDSPVHGFFALTNAVDAMFAQGDFERAEREFDRAIAIADRFGDRDVRALALTGKGRVFIKRGDVDGGLRLLDAGTAEAIGGDLDPYHTGIVYCMTISSCHDLGDFRRAAEWTEVANRWCDQLDVTGFPGACRIHRAEIMRLQGDLAGAEQQAVAACEELNEFDVAITAGGYYEVGEIRRQLGDFAAAEEAYRQAYELGRDPQPGLSLLRLAQGKVDGAVTAINRSLRDTTDTASRLRRLPAAVEIALAAGDLKRAREAALELEEVVDAYKIGGKRAPAYDAAVQMSCGRIRLAEGDADGAVELLRRARDVWREVGAPYEIAQARLLLGVAFRRAGDEDAASAELDAAASTFARVGAKLDEERAKELLGRQATRRTFLFSDIVESTRLLETLGDEKWQRLLRRHDELVREQIGEAGGQVIKHTGDGFFASFDSPKAALEAAVGIQRALAGEIVAPDVRIGVHTGGAFRTDAAATDFGGQGVHTAARVGAAAGPREILVSRETLDGVATAFQLSEPREVALKGVEAPLELVAVDWR